MASEAAAAADWRRAGLGGAPGTAQNRIIPQMARKAALPPLPRVQPPPQGVGDGVEHEHHDDQDGAGADAEPGIDAQIAAGFLENQAERGRRRLDAEAEEAEP